MSEKEGCTRTDCSQQASKAATMLPANICRETLHLLPLRICRTTEFMFGHQWRKKTWMQLACCVQDQPCVNRWWFRWQCPVLVLCSCTSSNQGLRSEVTITGIQFCWICFCRISAVFGDYYVFQQDGAPAHRARNVHCHHAAERNTRVYPSRDVATQFPRFESGGLQHLGYASREGLPLADPWCEGVERTSAEGVEAAGPHHHRGSDCAMA